ncbi:hypothetical protein M8C21_027658 [Ambrosia artemisiifolia]|uniref:Uncharacterized protein n=1 Tax=Ambrosia artemisiifolia TaxID=4212 RepID=A0AAD5BS30_AMBAR|nr:hypothetical protein M8C21_027658 [Ambrosia artemisiifolia]
MAKWTYWVMGWKTNGRAELRPANILNFLHQSCIWFMKMVWQGMWMVASKLLGISSEEDVKISANKIGMLNTLPDQLKSTLASIISAERAVNSSHSADDPRPSSTYLNPEAFTCDRFNGAGGGCVQEMIVARQRCTDADGKDSSCDGSHMMRVLCFSIRFHFNYLSTTLYILDWNSKPLIRPEVTKKSSVSADCRFIDKQTLTFLSVCQNQSVIGARGVFDQDPEAMITSKYTKLRISTKS